MSRLKELIDELCPDGVEFKSLGEIGTFTRGQGMSKEDKGKGDIPIILYGELYTTYGNYINEVFSKSSEAVIKRSPIIKKGDLLFPVSSTTKEALIGKASAYYCDFDSYLGSDAILFKHNEEPGYLVHLLNSGLIESKKMACVRGTTINHLDPKRFAGIKIPVPPREVQREIVRILDKFTELGALLETELVARKKQYEYYRDVLFKSGNKTEKRKIGDLTKVFSASRVHRKDWTNKGVPFLRSSDVISYYKGIPNSRGKAFISHELYEELSAKSGKFEKDDILITGGGTIGIPYIVESDAPLYVKDADLICIKKCKEFNSRFLYYYFLTSEFREYIGKITHDATIAHYTISQVQETPIPVLPIIEQERIVNLLDKFHALCNDISSGIPAEIAARKKQYEYYRDRLLTFREKKF